MIFYNKLTNLPTTIFLCETLETTIKLRVHDMLVDGSLFGLQVKDLSGYPKTVYKA